MTLKLRLWAVYNDIAFQRRESVAYISFEQTETSSAWQKKDLKKHLLRHENSFQRREALLPALPCTGGFCPTPTRLLQHFGLWVTWWLTPGPVPALSASHLQWTWTPVQSSLQGLGEFLIYTVTWRKYAAFNVLWWFWLLHTALWITWHHWDWRLKLLDTPQHLTPPVMVFPSPWSCNVLVFFSSFWHLMLYTGEAQVSSGIYTCWVTL